MFAEPVKESDGGGGWGAWRRWIEAGGAFENAETFGGEEARGRVRGRDDFDSDDIERRCRARYL